jgi:hypothetical protein
MMTLGKEPYPEDARADQATDFTPMPLVGSPGGSTRTAPLPGGMHSYRKVGPKDGRTCGYCGNHAYQICETCEATGLGCIFVCGSKSKRKNECMVKHVCGAPLMHGNSKFSEQGRLAAAAKKRARANGEDADDEDDEEEPPISSPLRQSQRNTRR